MYIYVLYGKCKNKKTCFVQIQICCLKSNLIYIKIYFYFLKSQKNINIFPATSFITNNVCNIREIITRYKLIYNLLKAIKIRYHL